MDDQAIKHMVNRFLGWQLPEDFSPDGGVSFQAVINEGTAYEHRNQPTGTNVFDYAQAESMVRHMLEGWPGVDSVGAAEHDVGRWVYSRIEKLIDAKPGTPEAAELAYFSEIVQQMEEYGFDRCEGLAD